jgi:hypothetical protein
MTTDPAWTATPEWPRPVQLTRPPGNGLRSPRSWGELLYAIIDLAPAIAFFVLIVTLLSVGLGLLIIYVGVPIIALAMLAARSGGLVQRSLAVALLDLPSTPPAWTQPRRPGPLSALGAVLRDPAGWRASAYFEIKIVLAPLTFGVAIGLYAGGIGAISYSLWRPFLPLEMASDGSLHRGAQWWPDFFVDSWASMAVLALIGAGVLWCAPRVVAFLTTIDRVLIVSLLSATDGQIDRPGAA